MLHKRIFTVHGSRVFQPSAGRPQPRRRRAKFLRVAAASAIFGWAVGITAPALAGWAYSQISEPSAGGVSYYDQAAIYASPGQNTVAETHIWTVSGQNVATGDMGAMAAMYYSNGNLCREGSYVYIGSPSNSLTVSTSPGCGAGLAYFSSGAVKIWNGTSYNTFATFESPDQNS